MFLRPVTYPLWEHICRFDYSSGITQCINQIGDHNEIQSDAAKFKFIRDKLLWYLLMVPRETLNRLLLQGLEDKNIVPGVINTLRSCRALSETAVVSENISGERVPVVVDLVVSIFNNEAHRWTVTEQQDRLVYLLTALCRRRRIAKEKADGAAEQATGARDESVVDGGMLLKLFVLHNLMKRTQETLMLKLLHRYRPRDVLNLLSFIASFAGSCSLSVPKRFISTGPPA
ncbi:unnamed protein product [Cylicostephanus goldi]|uniref:Edg1 TPR repeats region domain-containing protein n=1 Tax=Cylicostephanus goldi TaxID=71465 RepID=A0A3P6UB56_CYLGO|nr:unnamed protein product [Cylicostephanus goldi]